MLKLRSYWSEVAHKLSSFVFASRFSGGVAIQTIKPVVLTTTKLNELAKKDWIASCARNDGRGSD